MGNKVIDGNIEWIKDADSGEVIGYKAADGTERYIPGVTFDQVTGVIGIFSAGGKFAFLQSQFPKQVPILGDSIFASNTNWPSLMCAASSGRLSLGKNHGVAGENTSQINARVGSVSGQYCAVDGGTNDALQAIAQTVAIGNIKKSANSLFEKSIVPILSAIPPLNNDPSYAESFRIVLWNLARMTNSLYVDPFIGQYNADGSGTWASGKSADGVHPNPATELAAGTLAWTQLSSMSPCVPLPRMNSNQYGLFTNALMTSATANLATGWGKYGLETGMAYSQSVISGGCGKWQEFNMSATSEGTYSAYFAGSGTTKKAGDTFLVVGKFKIENSSNSQVNLYATLGSATCPVVMFQPNDIGETVFCVLTPQLTSDGDNVLLNLQMSNTAGNATWGAKVSVGELQIYNLANIPA